jgi:hypothetical protein
MSDDDRWDGGSPWLFLAGLVVFLGSALLFLADLARGVNVLRGIAANAVGAALLIGWAAHDTLYDPNSEVATRGGAAGTALLLYGLYLLLAGAVIGATGFLFHEYTPLALLYLGLAVVAVVVGFLVFPTDAIVDRDGADGADYDDGVDEADGSHDGAPRDGS